MTNLMRTLAAAMLVCLAAPMALAETRTATFAGGCFWCVESDFEKVPGVIDVISGFSGGETRNPRYKQVSSGGTGHLESVKIIYDDRKISYRQLVHLFFRSIDPTDAKGQFCDRGHTYTTAIFVSDPAERKVAEAEKLAAQKVLGRPVVTPIRQAGPFYPADDYHQNFYRQTKRIITRYGAVSKAAAYKRYRKSCGRDERTREIWGSEAVFAHPGS